MSGAITLRDYQRELAERLRSAGSARQPSKLGLQIGGEAWLVDLADAGEVLPVPRIAPLPLTQPWFRGVANIRGNLCSVVDFPAFLGRGQATLGEHARLLLFGERFRLGAGLLVERSLGLRNPAQLQPVEGEPGAWARACYADADGRQWKELDVPRLVAHPDFLAIGI